MGEQDTGEVKSMLTQDGELTKRFRNLYKAAADYWCVQGFNKITDLMLQIDLLDSNHYSDLQQFRSEYTDLEWNEKVESFRAGAAALPVKLFDDAQNLFTHASETPEVQVIIWTQGEIEEQSGKPHAPFGKAGQIMKPEDMPFQQYKMHASGLYELFDSERYIDLVTNVYPRVDMVIGGAEKLTGFKELLDSESQNRSVHGRRYLLVIDDRLENLRDASQIGAKYPDIDVIYYYINRNGGSNSGLSVDSENIIEVSDLNEIELTVGMLLVLDLDRTLIDYDAYKQAMEDLFIRIFEQKKEE